MEEKITNGENTTNETVRCLEEHLKPIEEGEEHRQCRERRNNIIIKSKELTGDTTNEIDTKVKTILQKLDYKEEYIQATYIGKDRLNNSIVRVELKNIEDKIGILKNKIKLKGAMLTQTSQGMKEKYSKTSDTEQKKKGEKVT